MAIVVATRAILIASVLGRNLGHRMGDKEEEERRGARVRHRL